MSIDVKCNSCGSTYSVTDKLAGGSVRCAKCRSPIHVPIVRQQPPAPRAATAAEAAGAADLDFDYSPQASPDIAASSWPTPAPPAPPPLPPAPSAPATPASNITAKAPASPTAVAPASQAAKFDAGQLMNRLRALSTVDFDFRFRNYWSGSLARSLWVVAICYAVYLAYSAISSLVSSSELSGELGRAFQWMTYLQIFFIIVGLAAIRIALETVSVLFNIAKTLREVRDELRRRP